MRLYIQYVESRHSEADKGISLNANWNKQSAESCYSVELYNTWLL